MKEHQAIEDLAMNSMYALVRDPSVPYEKLEATEPPVKDFTSGFIGASNDDLWRQLKQYREDEDKTDHASYIKDNIIVVLDKIAAEKDHILTLYRARDGSTHSWRMPFKFICTLNADLPDDEEAFCSRKFLDDEGVIDIPKLKKALGHPWEYGSA